MHLASHTFCAMMEARVHNTRKQYHLALENRQDANALFPVSLLTCLLLGCFSKLQSL